MAHTFPVFFPFPRGDLPGSGKNLTGCWTQKLEAKNGIEAIVPERISVAGFQLRNCNTRYQESLVPAGSDLLFPCLPGGVPRSPNLRGDPEHSAVRIPGWEGAGQCPPGSHGRGCRALPPPGGGRGAGAHRARAQDPHQAPRRQGPPAPVSLGRQGAALQQDQAVQLLSSTLCKLGFVTNSRLFGVFKCGSCRARISEVTGQAWKGLLSSWRNARNF